MCRATNRDSPTERITENNDLRLYSHRKGPRPRAPWTWTAPHSVLQRTVEPPMETGLQRLIVCHTCDRRIVPPPAVAEEVELVDAKTPTSALLWAATSDLLLRRQMALAWCVDGWRRHSVEDGIFRDEDIFVIYDAPKE